MATKLKKKLYNYLNVKNKAYHTYIHIYTYIKIVKKKRKKEKKSCILLHNNNNV